jgi:hypothetical protein
MHKVFVVLVARERANETDVVLFDGQTILYAFTVTERPSRGGWRTGTDFLCMSRMRIIPAGGELERQCDGFRERMVLDRIHQKPPETALPIHINKTGRLCFGKDAAARPGDAKYLCVAIDGETVRLDTLDNVRGGDHRSRCQWPPVCLRSLPVEAAWL